MPREHAPLNGNVYGDLRVLSLSHRSKTGIYYYHCRCVCGKTVTKNADKLKQQVALNCGCLSRNASEWARKPGRSVSSILQSYKRNAEKRDLPFLLDRAQFEKLIDGDCYYCGSHQTNSYKTSYSETKYNGIDRLDSTKGYYKDNCVSCCRICNRAKSDMSLDEFIDWIRKITKYVTK